MEIRIAIHTTEPLTGTATAAGEETLNFEGWLELLHALYPRRDWTKVIRREAGSLARPANMQRVIQMRKIVTWLYLSLDGVVESPEKWASSYFNDEMGEVSGSGMAASDTLLLGRRTYEEFAAYWPNQSSDVQFADYLNNTPKLVVSNTLKTVEWQNSRLIKGDVVQELTKLKQQPGKNITILGSATLVRSLLRHGLPDELGLVIFPIVVGAGRRLFENGADHVTLKLVQARTFSTGVLSVTYKPADR